MRTHTGEKLVLGKVKIDLTSVFDQQYSGGYSNIYAAATAAAGDQYQ